MGEIVGSIVIEVNLRPDNGLRQAECDGAENFQRDGTSC